MAVGKNVGPVGFSDGANDGLFVGLTDGALDGEIDGIKEGAIDGASLVPAVGGCAVTIVPHKKRKSKRKVYIKINASFIFIYVIICALKLLFVGHSLI